MVLRVGDVDVSVRAEGNARGLPKRAEPRARRIKGDERVALRVENVEAIRPRFGDIETALRVDRKLLRLTEAALRDSLPGGKTDDLLRPAVGHENLTGRIAYDRDWPRQAGLFVVPTQKLSAPNIETDDPRVSRIRDP